jgi:hypothetical protein
MADVENCWNFVDDGTPLPLEIEPGGRTDLPIAPRSRSRSSSGNHSIQARYSGLTCTRAGLSNTVAGKNVTLIGRGGSVSGGRLSSRGTCCIKASGLTARPHQVTDT